MNPTLFYEGAYQRDDDGTWRRAATGIVVPGAADIVLANTIPHQLVGDREHGQVWVPRPAALTLPWFRPVLEALPPPLVSIMLPEPQSGLPPDTRAVILIPAWLWANHADRVVGMSAPELSPELLMTTEMVATAAGLSPDSLMEYVRRGACPQPALRLNRTPLWPRPIIEHWLASRPSQMRTIACTGCGAPTEGEALMVEKSAGGLGSLPICPDCYGALLRRLAHRESGLPLTVEDVHDLLVPEPSSADKKG